MRKNCAVFLFFIFFSIAASGYAESYYEGGLVIIGVTGRQSSRNKSIEKALEDAARKVAFYHSVGGRIVDVEASGFGYESATYLYYNDDYKQYIKDLHYDPVTDVFDEKDVFFVRAVYSGAKDLGIDYIGPPGKKRPLWINDPPEKIGGYQVAVAMSGRQSTPAKTIITSYENAVFTLLQINEAVIQVQQTTDDDGSFSSVLSSTSSGILNGFYVLDFWTDPKTKAVWTLAVARSFIAHDYSGENQ